ncbi:MAG: hypothetical protein RBR67_15400 [Desulfobacterium sp.]|nr:hypothetical protein [Desulfobacterium sp.]
MKYSWQQLNDLLLESGGAVYILNLETFKRNINSFLGSFRQYYKNTFLGYSYKTNYLPKLCVEANSMGLYAEVVSGMEYEIALKCGVLPKNIIFNGPVKYESELLKAFDGNSIVNVDSLNELYLIKSILSSRADLSANIGLRCNLELKLGNRSSRFGLNDTNGDLENAANLIESIPNANLAGLHCHFSFNRSAESYSDRAFKMVDIAKRVFKKKPPQYLDLGGGFCGPMNSSLANQFSVKPPNYSDYAKAITSVVLKEYGKEGGPKLILEPGIGLVGNVMEYACKVEVLKNMTGQKFAVTSGTIDHIKILPNKINLPVSLLSEKNVELQKSEQTLDIVGYTCLEHDILYYNYPWSLTCGDILLFESVGAYSFVSSSQFIKTTPPIVMSCGNLDWKILKNHLSSEDLFSQFNL